MKTGFLFFSICIFFSILGMAQTEVIDSAATRSTEKHAPAKVSVGGYIDTYYGYDFSRPSSKDRLYFVSSARHNEFAINLAFVDIKFTSQRVRATLRPAIGTYMEANYRAEPAIFSHLYEGNAGVKLFAKKNIWLDAGVLGSPYTNESAISKDHLMYTRSLAPEYVPYYLSGVKMSVQISTRTSVYLYLINGWQNIQETNEGKSVGTQVEYKPNNKWLINWNTYLGDERSEANPENRTRYFSDLYFIFNPEGKFSATACLYMGAQERIHLAKGDNRERVYWHNANLIGRYRFSPSFSLSGRLEFFNDPATVQIIPVNEAEGFRTYSSSLCINYALTDTILMRLEARAFFSDKDVYQTREAAYTNKSNLVIASMAVSF